jgi:molecular chaperone GrpE
MDESIQNQTADEATVPHQCESYLVQWKRAVADYENLQKDMMRERSHMRVQSVYTAATMFLPVYDNFLMAFANVPAEASENMQQWITGVEHIKKQFATALRELGLEEIGCTGPVDTRFHEVIGSESKDGATQDEIARCVQPGYRIGETVVRVAKVLTVNNN